MFRRVVPTPRVLVDATTNSGSTVAMVVFLAMTFLVVGTSALAFSLGLVLMCEKDLFCLQLELIYLFPDLGEPLFRVVVGELCHVGLVVGRVVRARLLNGRAIVSSANRRQSVSGIQPEVMEGTSAPSGCAKPC